MTDESGQSYPLTSTRCSIAPSVRKATTARSSPTCTPTPRCMRARRHRRLGAGARRAGHLGPTAADVARWPQRLLVRQHRLERHDARLLGRRSAPARPTFRRCCPATSGRRTLTGLTRDGAPVRVFDPDHQGRGVRHLRVERRRIPGDSTRLTARRRSFPASPRRRARPPRTSPGRPMRRQRHGSTTASAASVLNQTGDRRRPDAPRTRCTSTGLAGIDDLLLPRHLRGRQAATRRRSRRRRRRRRPSPPSTPPTELPVHDLAGLGGSVDAVRVGCQRGGARRQSSLQRRRLHHRHPLLQGRRRMSAPTSAICGRPPARCWARVTFTDETASGWQQAALAPPVAVTANTTYVVSYHTDSGLYAGDSGFFQSAGVTNGPLTALANGVDGPNGVFKYGPSGFPNRDLQQRELLGGRGVRHLRGCRRHAAYCDRDDPGQRRDRCRATSAVTATFSEDVNPSSVTAATSSCATRPTSWCPPRSLTRRQRERRRCSRPACWRPPRPTRPASVAARPESRT